MIYGKLLGLALILVTLASCANQQPVEVFPEITHLDRVWQDEAGQFYSAIQEEDGEFAVHDPSTGAYYYYWLEQEGASLQARPAHAPSLAYRDRILHWGERRLTPAAVSSREISFENAGTIFHGVLVVPEDVHAPVPVIVNTHGSERTGAVSFDWAASWYTQQGFATFLFDKRGTGRSGGDYTHDFELLASDLEAAIAAVAQQPDIDAGMIGVGGYSQGVFVGTLAASRNPAIKFLIAGYGVMEPPIREDFLETRLHFEANYPDQQWAEFAPLVLACEQAFAMGDKSAWKEVSAHKRQWRGRIDANDLSGTLTGDGCLRWPPIALRLVGKSQFPPGLDWGFDPAPLMAELDIPVLFQYGEADVDAPFETSAAKIESWIASGKPFTLHTYPGATHGMYMRSTDSAGNNYRYKEPKYLADLIQWLGEIRADDHRTERVTSR